MDRKHLRWREAALLGLLLALGLYLRTTHLSADPPALLSRDFITDEGQWAHNARNKLAFDNWVTDEYNPGLYSAYLYNSIVYASLKGLGNNFVALRLPSALAGWLTLVFVYLLIRRLRGRREATIALFLLGLSDLHILYSRTAFVESLLTMFLALTLWLWTLRGRHALLAVACGMAFALMILTKSTSLYLLPGLALLLLAERASGDLKGRQLFWIAYGAALVAVFYVPLFLTPHFADWLHFNLAFSTDHEWPEHFSEWIAAVEKLFGSKFYLAAPVLTALSFVAVGQALLSASRQGLKRMLEQAGACERMGLSLLVGYLPVLALTVYQPERRFIPLLLPMALLSARVLEAGGGWFEQMRGAERRTGSGAWAVALLPLFAAAEALLLLPAFTFGQLKWGALSSPSAPWFWLFKVIPLLGFLIICARLARRGWLYRFRGQLLAASRLTCCVIVGGLCAALLWKSLSLLGAGRTAQALLLACLIATAAGLAIARRRLNLRPMAYILILIAVVEGAQISTWLLQPTYTLKETGEALAGLVQKGEVVATKYETALTPTAAKALTYWQKANINEKPFERFEPEYLLILRRDNWRTRPPEAMPDDEWPPPPGVNAQKVKSFELCPTKGLGPRFVLELYDLKGWSSLAVDSPD